MGKFPCTVVLHLIHFNSVIFILALQEGQFVGMLTKWITSYEYNLINMYSYIHNYNYKINNVNIKINYINIKINNIYKLIILINIILIILGL